MARADFHSSRRSRSWAALSLGLLASALAGAGGCAQKRVQAAPELPPLAAPGPPPRILPPLEGGPIEGALPGSIDAPARTAPSPRPRSSRSAEPAARPEPARAPETRPDEPGTPAEETAEAAPALQLVPSGAEAARIEVSIRQQLGRAAADLNRVDYRALNLDARTQYDTAKRYIELANQALRDRNLIFARTLAEKAGSIAVVLMGR